MISKEPPLTEQIPKFLVFDTSLTSDDVRIYMMLAIYAIGDTLQQEAEDKIAEVLQIDKQHYRRSLDRLEEGGWIHTFLSGTGGQHITLYTEKRADYRDIVFEGVKGDEF